MTDTQFLMSLAEGYRKLGNKEATQTAMRLERISAGLTHNPL